MNKVMNGVSKNQNITAKDDLQDRIGYFDPQELGLPAEELQYILSREDEEWMMTLSYEFREQYADQYVAVRHKQVIAASRSLREVYEQLEAQGIGSAAIAYIEDPSKLLIYHAI